MVICWEKNWNSVRFDLTGGLGFKGCKLYMAEELWYYCDCANCSGLKFKIVDSKHVISKFIYLFWFLSPLAEWSLCLSVLRLVSPTLDSQPSPAAGVTGVSSQAGTSQQWIGNEDALPNIPTHGQSVGTHFSHTWFTSAGVTCVYSQAATVGNEDALPNIPTHIILWEYYHYQISHPWSDYICQIFHPRSEILLNIPTKITNNTKYSHSRSEHTPGSHTNETPRSALPNPVTCIP